jgi:hypothetical protein
MLVLLIAPGWKTFVTNVSKARFLSFSNSGEVLIKRKRGDTFVGAYGMKCHLLKALVLKHHCFKFTTNERKL